MNLEVLVSTYKSRLLENEVQIEQLQKIDHIIIDQSPLNESDYPEGLNIVPLKNSSGLTKNRNKAIENAKGEILLISDDDIEYTSGFENTIVNAFKDNPNAAVISFQVIKPDGVLFKNYKNSQFGHNKRSVISTSSVELAFRSDILKKHNLKFDENFGVNAKFPCGEEAVLLGQCLDLGLEVIYFPKPICIHPEESSGKDYNRKNLLLAKGAMIRKLYGALGFLLIFAFQAFLSKQWPR